MKKTRKLSNKIIKIFLYYLLKQLNMNKHDIAVYEIGYEKTFGDVSIRQSYLVRATR